MGLGQSPFRRPSCSHCPYSFHFQSPCWSLFRCCRFQYWRFPFQCQFLYQCHYWYHFLCRLQFLFLCRFPSAQPAWKR